MYKKTKTFKAIVVVALCLVTSTSTGFGQVNYLNGTDFFTVVNNNNVYESLLTNDPFYPDPAISQDCYIIEQFCDVSLEFKHDGAHLLDGTFEVNLELSIDAIDINGNSLSIGPKELNIDYNSTVGSPYKELDLIRFENIAYIHVGITGVNTTEQGFVYDDYKHMLTLKAEISSDYYKEFDLKSPEGLSHSYKSYSNELVIDWDNKESCNEYDLEWTFIHNSDGHGGTISPSI